MVINGGANFLISGLIYPRAMVCLPRLALPGLPYSEAVGRAVNDWRREIRNYSDQRDIAQDVVRSRHE